MPHTPCVAARPGLIEALEESNKALERVNEKLVAAEALKSHFLSNIRNEINNPLTAILGLAENIKGENQDIESMKLMARMIYQEAFNLDFQLRTIFSAAEIEAGEAYMHSVQIQLPVFFQRIFHSFDALIAEKQLVFETRGLPAAGDGIAGFQSDPEKLHLVLAHLISNAIEFSQAGGRILVEVLRDDRGLLFTVTDSGCGIAPEDHERIFDRFVQLDAGLTKTHRGHGLGLAVAKGAAELMGGRISLKSQKGQGAVFCFEVPELQRDANLNIFALDGNEEMF